MDLEERVMLIILSHPLDETAKSVENTPHRAEYSLQVRVSLMISVSE